MGSPKEPKPVKLFVALLSQSAELFPAIEGEFSALFGPIDSSSQTLPWSVTPFYEREMGRGLLRRFVSFAPLISPDSLSEIKLQSQEVEASHQWVEGEKRGRKVNIDPGYLDAGKVVLASTKGAAHRIYLRSGIYGEITLLYSNGSFQPFAYTYLDYLWPDTMAFLAASRSRYLEQLKENT